MTTATEQRPRNLTPAELAAVVRTFREMRSWSQEQLAEIARLSARTVQRVEEGVPSSVDTRRALAAAFGCEDINAFNKPYVIPTAQEGATAKERFEKEHVTLKVALVQSGKQLASLAQGCHASLFSEGVELSGEAEELFAGLSDYCREELDNYVANLARAGVCLGTATRAVVLSAPAEAPGVPIDILYVVAFPKSRAPEHIAVQRQVQFG